MEVPSIALNVSLIQYASLVSLGNHVVTNLDGNLNFLTPAVPIVDLQTAITDVESAIVVWGPKNNHGTKADLSNLKQAAITLHQLLKAEANYVQTTAIMAGGNDFTLVANIMISSGFELKSTKHSQGVLHAVQNLKFRASGALNRNQVKLAWAKPLEVTSQNNVKSYNVYRSVTTNFANAIHIDTVSKAEYVDTNNTGATVTWSYFIVAVGAAGEGAVSDPITVTFIG